MIDIDGGHNVHREQIVYLLPIPFASYIDKPRSLQFFVDVRSIIT